MTGALVARSISVIEDNDQFRSALVDWLCGHGFKVTGFSNGRDFLKQLHATHSDLILSDVRMPEIDGLTLLHELQDMGVKTPVIMMSSSLDQSLKCACMNHGALAFLSKPFEGDELLKVMDLTL